MNRPFSHSSIAKYEQCPARYQFYYVNGIEKPQESVESFLGRRVHEALEFLYGEVLNDRIPLFDTIMDFFHSRWNKEWHTDIVIVNRYKSLEDYRSIGEKCITWYYRKFYPFNEPVMGIEIEINFQIGDNGKYRIKGIIDRLDHDGDGVWEIHDYKTSKRTLSQYEADRDRQLALYQIGLEQICSDVKEVDLIWHFLQSGNIVRSKRSKEQLEKLKIIMRKRIDEITSAVEAQQPFPARESMLCNWCYYWEECPSKHTNNPFVKTQKWN